MLVEKSTKIRKNEKSQIEKAPQADNNPKLNAFRMHQNDLQKLSECISKLKIP